MFVPVFVPVFMIAHVLVSMLAFVSTFAFVSTYRVEIVSVSVASLLVLVAVSIGIPWVSSISTSSGTWLGILFANSNISSMPFFSLIDSTSFLASS